MRNSIELIEHSGARLALIIRDAKTESGVEFFSDGDDYLQVGAFSLPQGHQIAPHVHEDFSRSLDRTTEVLILQSGRLRVDFYSREKIYFQSRELGAGDVIVLFDGGHGFTVLEELRMLEVKQGPYGGDKDKIRFVRPADLSKPI